MSFITLRHNIEVAHRLYDLKGKCEQIHGHSMWVELSLFGTIGSSGILSSPNTGEPFEFGEVKKLFRDHLDSTYDHRLLLNKADPFAGPFYFGSDEKNLEQTFLPGLHPTEGDPTTENLARWISLWASWQFKVVTRVKVHETSVNAAEAGALWLREQARAEESY